MELPILVSNTQVVINGDMASDIISSSVYVGESKILCAQISWSGSSPVGNFYVQGSNDGSNWADASSAVAVSGNSGSLLINLSNIGFLQARIFYDVTSGTGTLQGSITAKR